MKNTMPNNGNEKIIPIQPPVYYRVHCTECAMENLSADKLAFDVGEIIRKIIVDQSGNDNKNADLIQMKKYFVENALDFCMYYTAEEIDCKVRTGNGTYVLTIEDFIMHLIKLVNLYDVTTLDDLINSNEGLRLLVSRVKLVKKDLGRGTDRSGLGDGENKKEKIEDVVKKFCAQTDPKDVIVKFDVNIMYGNDDQGLPLATSIKVTYDTMKGKRNYTFDHRVCPSCGKIFTTNAGLHKEYLIGMAGSPYVGKTAYLAALVHQLKKISQGSSFLKMNSDRTDPDWIYFQSKILSKYEHCCAIPKTEENVSEVPVFTLYVTVNDEIEQEQEIGKKNTPNFVGRSERMYTLVFIDMPGEAYLFGGPTGAEEEIMQRSNKSKEFIDNDMRIIGQVDLIWCCFAPDQVDDSLITADKKEKTKGWDDIIAGLNLFRNVTESQKKYAAILITKSDEANNNADNSKFHLYDPNKNGMECVLDKYLQVQEVKEHMRKVIGYLKENGKDAENDIRPLFRSAGYFAVAAYGCIPYGAEMQPDGTKKLQPSLICMPFIWTLAMLGIVKAQETRTVAVKRMGIFPALEEREVDVTDPNELVYTGDI